MTLLRQPRRRQLLAVEALRELLRAWWLVRFRAFRSYVCDLGEAKGGAFETEALHDDIALLRDVRWAIEAVNRTFGGRFTCLMQGMAGKVMLNRRGVPNTLVLGAKINGRDGGETTGADGMAAHAWLCAGPVVLLGGEARAGFVPVTSYHSA
ncbi:MAG: lasso peptide biosynthesis B2 protein [Paracoccaceae bacterium]|nr:lasso peptide biosynthesis B2 protein [Paracoccaceae bacterium]